MKNETVKSTAIVEKVNIEDKGKAGRANPQVSSILKDKKKITYIDRKV